MKTRPIEFREDPDIYQCSDESCNWKGKDEDRAKEREDIFNHLCCPNCGNRSFYGLKFVEST